MAQLIGTMQPCKEDLEKIRKLMLELYLKDGILPRYILKDAKVG